MLQVADSVGKDKTVTRADRLDNATGEVVLSSTQVRLVDCVKLSAAAHNLGPM